MSILGRHFWESSQVSAWENEAERKTWELLECFKDKTTGAWMKEVAVEAERRGCVQETFNRES